MTAVSRNRTVWALALAAVSSAGAIAATARLAAAEPSVSFSRDVKPLLARRCFACHGPTKREGGLRLDQQAGALAEIDSGFRAIIPGNLEESVLLDRVAETDETLRMPPVGRPLADSEIALLRSWIAAGAPWQKHWAFVPPAPQSPPAVKNSAWIGNPIDGFVLAGLERAGLEPAPRADKRTLARRAYFDLTGLPPTNEELEKFLADDSPDAWEHLVDELLASPHYGEHWGRHWLDVVRFAETNSFERDTVKPNAWKYRDYVIRSLNDDKPYDQFLREQLAGDELEEVTDDSIIATGYYRLGIWDDEPADPLQARYDELDDIVSTTSQAMLGLTVGCARCHDHKIDPIPQADYYGMVAFFADVTPYADPSARDPAQYSQWDMSPPKEHERREKLRQDQDLIRKEMTAMEQAGIGRMSAEDQRKTEGPDREAVLKDKLEKALNTSEWLQYQDSRKRLERVERQINELPEPNAALALAKCTPRPEPTHLLTRGSPHAPAEVVAPHFPALFEQPAPEIPEAAADAHSAGRRRVLADWIVSPANMLTSRVAANRVWQHHFGRGIVRSANNFGELGTPPTHPELLDWLAQWLVDHHWRLKPLHRLIMTSSTYQMSSATSERALALDPTNDLFWRFNLRRLGAEEIRDATLVAADRLNPKMFGPGFYEQLSPEVLATQSRPGDGWGESPPEDRCRRAIYIHVKRSLLPPLLTAFDFPDVDGTCEARFDTTQPGQALAMLHGSFLNERAAELAERVELAAGDKPADQVAAAIRFALNRSASQDEIAEGVQVINDLAHDHKLAPRDALKYWCLVVLNLNEFMYLD